MIIIKATIHTVLLAKRICYAHSEINIGFDNSLLEMHEVYIC